MVTNVLSGETISLGEGKGDNWLPTWSSDGRYIAFLSDRDGSRQAKLWVWEMQTHKLRKISDVSIRTSEIQWASNSQILTTTWSGATGPDDDSACKETAGRDPSGSADRTESPTVVIYGSDQEHHGNEQGSGADPWNLDTDIRDIALLDIADGKMRVLSRRFRICTFLLSPDRSQVAFTSEKNFEKPGSQQIRFDLGVITLATGEIRIVASNVRLDVAGRSFTWSADSSQLVFQAGGPLEQTGDCYLVTAKGGEVRNLTSLPQQRDASPGYRFPPVWDQRRQQIYFLRDGILWKASTQRGGGSELARIAERHILRIIAQQHSLSNGTNSIIVLTDDRTRKQNGFYKIDPATGKSTVLLERGERYWASNEEGFQGISSNAEQLVYPAQDARHPLDLWVTDVNFAHPRRLTHINPDIDDYRLGEARLVHWRSLDGDKLSGALLLPPHYEPDQKYPLIVLVYGGSSGSDDVNQFGFTGLGQPYNMQLFATRGYAVLAPDAPQHGATPMLDLAKTILPGVDKIVEMGIADPDRIGVMGHSYGGYSVLSLLVQTTRFKTAMVSDGFGDLVGAYGEMDSQGSAYQTSTASQGLMGGTPWEYRDKYIENSPMFYLDRIKTPVLIVHGGADTVVAPFLADEVFVALRRLGVPVVYAKYAGENHYPYIWSRRNQLDLCNRMISWFDRLLGGDVQRN